MDLREQLAEYTRFGWRAGAIKALKRALAPLADVGSVVVVELPMPPGPLPAGAREAGPEDAAQLARIFGSTEDKLAARFARGDRAFLAVPDGAPQHVRWVTTLPTHMPECELWICPGPGQVYLYDMATVPAARGHKLAALVRGFLDGQLAADGYRSKLAYVRADNHAMWRAMRDAPGPLRRLMRIGYVKPHGRKGIALGRYRPPVFKTPPARSG